MAKPSAGNGRKRVTNVMAVVHAIPTLQWQYWKSHN